MAPSPVVIAGVAALALLISFLNSPVSADCAVNDGDILTDAHLVDIGNSDEDCKFKLKPATTPAHWALYYDGPTAFGKVEYKRSEYSKKVLKFEDTANFDLAVTMSASTTSEIFSIDAVGDTSGRLRLGWSALRAPYATAFGPGGSFQIAADFAHFDTRFLVGSNTFMKTAASQSETFSVFEERLTVAALTLSEQDCTSVTPPRKLYATESLGVSTVPLGPLPGEGDYYLCLSKDGGAFYVHTGGPHNYNMHKYAETNFDLRNQTAGSESEVQAKFDLLAVCQRVFVAIVKSAGDVPPIFRDIFAHVRACMVERFPIAITDMEGVVAENLAEHVGDTAEAYNTSADAVGEVLTFRNNLVPDPARLIDMTTALLDAVDRMADGVADLNKHTKRMEGAFDDLESALDPESAAARRLLLQHSNKQNAIAVGGFYFLRFLVPAITAPEAYHLVRDLPTVSQRQMLVLVGKVLQNLSNGKNFGGKEAYMTKLNDFIDSNRNKIAVLFDDLSQPVGDYEVVPFLIPEDKYQTALANIYRHVQLNYNKIVAAFGAYEARDAHEAQLATQIGGLFAHTMGTVRQNVQADSSCADLASIRPI